MNTTHIQEQRTTYSIYYRIAEHLVFVQFPIVIQHDRCLPSFVPFEVTPVENEQATLQFQLTFDSLNEYSGQTKLLSDLSIVWGDRFRFEESEEHYITSVSSDGVTKDWNMLSSKDFKTSIIHASEKEIYANTVLSWLLMVSFGQAVLGDDTIMIHSSVVEKDGQGFAFLGKSGTGKSTHSRLWIKYNKGFQLLNDDNPAIRILANNKVMIYGTPWSGKTPCYRNLAVELKGIIRLNQASANSFEKKIGTAAFITLLPSCSSIRWNRSLFASMNNTVQRIVQLLPIGYLNCLPDAAAAVLAYQEITKKEITTLNKIENE
ncbi:hypothetical protein LZQ00_17230 [Sphingobacterium sp. SRCM116780]|uniref:hypothetical protein n=1 Tax=Sphingobacterium sp. SRCM116780 TaxID=2907623 RepID=UPI001F2E344D|nr:hypothetical protein [Sphingobacterium sp. SRCM116780]UIR55993.1 hypothetical protein LZQ00_17230 [Sphingobacterium sp. SRCM116780]